MKKTVGCFLMLLCLLCAFSCCAERTLPDEKDPVILKALDLIIEAWNQESIESMEKGRDLNPYLQIIYTRQFDIIPGGEYAEKFNDIFPDVVSVIVFDLHANYFGDDPVLDYAGVYTSVVVKKDGTMEVQKTSPFRTFRSKTYITDFKDWVTVKDYGGLYNGVYIE